MNELGNILIAGTGPAAVQCAVLLRALPGELGIAGRASRRSDAFFAALDANAGIAQVQVQNTGHAALAGRVCIDHRYRSYQQVRGVWGTLVLAVTADAYLPVLRDLPQAVLDTIARIVLLSPTLGSAALVREFARSSGADPEIISLSSYLADTRQVEGAGGALVLTAGTKNRIYAGSTGGDTPALQRVRAVHAAAGTQVKLMGLPVEAEARNMSLYVHPALFFNEVALRAVFTPAPPTQYVYKLYPEGPVTPALIHSMAEAWRELSAITTALGGQPVNLLAFMLDDGYPVHPQSIAPGKAASFEQLPAVEQEYLLYVRYASLLIDPFSQPDELGRYFDFSAIAFRPVFRNDQDEWDVPRMPKEDYYRTKIIAGMARKLAVPCPMLDSLLGAYEKALAQAAEARKGENCSPAFAVQDFAADLDMISAGIGCAA
ncbi:opine metallophore biosynthesis dehydrogenase [Glutamicibacter nicotianae]|uniref:opine metallophore biosynthesis dehydrogenase n=1 Tax=Glutamicibacter nicotianae TaxID=37929 RepID=UPI0025539A8C|nr:opine metallophore biosynthesis dehydrogenase [Glutamicibacter nicotianae]WIV45047.1 opine metallophore biosynthesis dehydrogenase [Glutamicibacter nicotianae]